MVAEQVPVTEFSVRHRASDFGFLVVAAFCFGEGGAAAFTRLPRLLRYARLLMNGAAAGLARDLEDLLAAARVQATGGRRSGQAVRVPVVGELLPHG